MNAAIKIIMWMLGVLITIQFVLWFLGYPRLIWSLASAFWNKAENDVFASVLMKLFSLFGLLTFGRFALIKARYYADRNINYDEVRVQFMHFVSGVFFMETLQGSGTELHKVIHNKAYREAIHQMLKAEGEDSVLPLWKHKWGHSIVGAISEFVNSLNHDPGVKPTGCYIVPSVIRTEQHTTCLTLNVMSRETLTALRNIDELHSAKVAIPSHMDRLVVAARAAQLFSQSQMDVYPTKEEETFQDYVSRCFRALRLDRDGADLLSEIQMERKRLGKPEEVLVNWTSDEVVKVLQSFLPAETAIEKAASLARAQAEALKPTPAIAG